MPTLTRQRCFTHPLREAAARCPSCERFFCRECVTEHDGRVICAVCLREEIAAADTRKRAARRPWRLLASAVRGAQFVFGVVLAWLFFYLLGQGLLSMPDQFHEGALWESIDKAGNNP